MKTDCDKDGVSTIYDLYGVVNHFGSLNGGHYTAYGKNPNGNWYNFNDSSVSGANKKELTSAAAYMLFYRRREAATGKGASKASTQAQTSMSSQQSD